MRSFPSDEPGEDSPPVRFGCGPRGEHLSAYSPPGYVPSDETEPPLEGEVFLDMDSGAGPFWRAGGLLAEEYEQLQALLGISRALYDDAVAWGHDESVRATGAGARRLALTRRLRAEVNPDVGVSQTGRQGSRPELLHIAYASQWAEAQGTGGYPWSTRGMTYAEVGFVHCAEPDQVEGVLGRFYADVEEPLVLLRLEVAGLEAAGAGVRWEQPPGGAAGSDAFPHIYAPLDPAWVMQTRSISPRDA